MKSILISTTNDPKTPYRYEIKGGSISYNGALDMLLNCLGACLGQTRELIIQEVTNQHPETPVTSEEEKGIRAALYDKTNLAMSALLTNFFPESAELPTISDKVADFDKFAKKFNKEKGKQKK